MHIYREREGERERERETGSWRNKNLYPLTHIKGIPIYTEIFVVHKIPTTSVFPPDCCHLIFTDSHVL